MIRMRSGIDNPLRVWLGVLTVAALGASAPGAGPPTMSAPGLRLAVTFDTGEPIAAVSAGDPRMTRIWMGTNYSRRPNDGSKGRISLQDCIVPDRAGKFAFAPRTDACFRATGNLNPESGTFAAWLGNAMTAARGRLLFAAKSFIAGGPRGGVHWSLTLNAKGFLELAIGDGSCRTELPLSAAPWVHVAAVWDADQGMKLYVNGEPAGSTWGTQPFSVTPAPVGRLQVGTQGDGGAVDDILVFDLPLAAPAVAGLAAGTAAPALPAEVSGVDAGRRLQALGWGPGLDGDLIEVSAGRPVTVREVVASRAYSDHKASGHLACDGMALSAWPWWYHGYQFVERRRLHLLFDGPEVANYLVARGDLTGTVRDGGTPDVPDGGRDVLELSGGPALLRKRLAQPLRAASASVIRQGGKLAEIHLYEVAAGVPQQDASAREFYPGGAQPVDTPLAEVKQQELVSVYPPEDRAFLVLQREPGAAPAPRPLEPLVGFHLLTAPMAADFPLAAIRLRLLLGGLAGPTRMRLTVHDGLDLWRELGVFDLRVTPAAAGPSRVDVTLDLRDTIVCAGNPVWLTCHLERRATLICRPEADASRVTLYEADPERAESLFLEWELATWRDCFESMSEPRPWSYVSDEYESCWWLIGCAPEYEHMDRIGREILQRFPDEPRARAWFQYIHPRMENLAKQVPLPAAGPYPEWAVRARDCYRLCHHFAAWWSRHRAAPNGELGNFYGDDTDLIQDWPDLGMIADPQGLLAKTVRRCADGVWSEWKIGGVTPLHRNGLNTRFKDGLHAYEEGINVQPLALLLDYGNPVLVERLMATCARYDGYLFTKAENNQRRFVGSWWGTDPERPPDHSPHSHYCFLFCHPGLALLWYNAHPIVLDIFRQAADWKLSTWDPKNPFRIAYGGSFFFTGLYLHTGNAEYLKPLTRSLQASGVCLDSTLCNILPEHMYDKAKTLASSRADHETRFDYLGTTALGFGETRYEKSYLEWYLTGDKQYLVEGLSALYQRLHFTMPALTVAEQSGDRVSVPKRLVSRMYLGGLPAGRMYLYPIFGVSYVGLNLNYAALVLENKPDRIKILFFNFDARPQRGGVRVWHVDPGTYQVRSGPDADADDRVDAPATRLTRELWRGAETPIELPPRQLWIWEARQIAKGKPLYERPDVALAAEELQVDAAGTLTVPVHNIGCVPVRDVAVALRTPGGDELARQVVAGLEAPLDFRPRLQTVTFGRPPGTTAAIVEIDPDRRLSELTRANNTAAIRFP